MRGGKNVVLVTPQPTSTPGTPPPLQSLVSRIQSYSPWTSFDDENSGQSLGLAWIAEDEYSLSIESEPLFMRRFALAVLYFASNGPLSWTIDILADGGECTYLPCDEEGFVVAIKLVDVPGDDLVTGTFPPEMALLSRMTLFAPSIRWEGSLPTTIRLMTALKILGLSQLPTSIENVEDLSHERLPSEIGNAVSLETLALGLSPF